MMVNPKNIWITLETLFKKRKTEPRPSPRENHGSHLSRRVSPLSPPNTGDTKSYSQPAMSLILQKTFGSKNGAALKKITHFCGFPKKQPLKSYRCVGEFIWISSWFWKHQPLKIRHLDN